MVFFIACAMKLRLLDTENSKPTGVHHPEQLGNLDPRVTSEPSNTPGTQLLRTQRSTRAARLKQ
eukprot:4682060-Pyramimonas_sp.AAC.1